MTLETRNAPEANSLSEKRLYLGYSIGNPDTFEDIQLALASQIGYTPFDISGLHCTFFHCPNFQAVHEDIKRRGGYVLSYASFVHFAKRIGESVNEWADPLVVAGAKNIEIFEVGDKSYVVLKLQKDEEVLTPNKRFLAQFTPLLRACGIRNVEEFMASGPLKYYIPEFFEPHVTLGVSKGEVNTDLVRLIAQNQTILLTNPQSVNPSTDERLWESLWV